MQNVTAYVGPYMKPAVETLEKLLEVIGNTIPKEADQKYILLCFLMLRTFMFRVCCT